MEDSSPSSEQAPQSCNFDAEKLDLKLSVTLAADRDAVDPVVRSVMKVVREMKCAPGREDDIELALTEALANAVVHGAKNDPSKIADPCQGENIYSNHGRGIYLINQLMDEVRFHKNGTEIHMLKK
jgi:serine/threonine-protein kinase RsbW